jgi:predicted amidohydrolase
MTYEASDKTTTASKAHYERRLEELSLFEKNKIISGSGGMKHSLLINNRTYVFFDRQRIFSYGKKSNMGDYFEDSEKGIYVPGREDGFTAIGKLKVGFEGVPRP